jgi:hypothetical protein
MASAQTGSGDARCAVFSQQDQGRRQPGAAEQAAAVAGGFVVADAAPWWAVAVNMSLSRWSRVSWTDQSDPDRKINVVAEYGGGFRRTCF